MRDRAFVVFLILSGDIVETRVGEISYLVISVPPLGLTLVLLWPEVEGEGLQRRQFIYTFLVFIRSPLEGRDIVPGGECLFRFDLEGFSRGGGERVAGSTFRAWSLGGREARRADGKARLDGTLDQVLSRMNETRPGEEIG